MAGRIMTSGTTGPAISTRREAGEGLRDWIVRHAQALNACSLAGDNLMTTWPSATGPLAFATYRAPAESDEEFKYRHIEAYPGQISSSPPLP